MTKANLALFENQRKEVMSLGLTEAQYAEMIETGSQMICKMLEALDQGPVAFCTRFTLIDSTIGNLVEGMRQELTYIYRLIVCRYDREQDDLKQFLADRKTVLQLLLEDWKGSQKPAAMPIQNH